MEEEKKKEKGPLKKELEQMLEHSQTETLRVQDAYKTALDREKDLCLEIDQIKVERDSALKAKWQAGEDLKAAKVALKEATELGEEKSGEVDDFIKLISETEVKLDAAIKKIATKEKEIERLKSKPITLPEKPLKQVEIQKPRPLFRIFSFCGGLAMILVLALAGSIYLELAPTTKQFIIGKVLKMEASDSLTGVSFHRTSDNVDVIGSYNMPLENIREPISNWASENGFDSVLFGTIRRWGGKEVLDTGANHVSLSLIIKEMRRRGDKKSISFAKNPNEITLPSPFVKTSQGDIQFWQTRKKHAGFIPSFWSDKKQLQFKSENFSGTIRDGKVKAKVGKMPLEEMYPIDKAPASH